MASCERLRDDELDEPDEVPEALDDPEREVDLRALELFVLEPRELPVLDDDGRVVARFFAVGMASTPCDWNCGTRRTILHNEVSKEHASPSRHCQPNAMVMRCTPHVRF